jgi:hypothetical protein
MRRSRQIRRGVNLPKGYISKDLKYEKASSKFFNMENKLKKQGYKEEWETDTNINDAYESAAKLKEKNYKVKIVKANIIGNYPITTDTDYHIYYKKR